MTPANEAKKIIETRALTAARRAGVPIPAGEIPGEGPDFCFSTKAGILGVEVSELLRPASRDSCIMPAAAAYHRQVAQMAQERYYRLADAKPARVSACERKHLIRIPFNRRNTSMNDNQAYSRIGEFIESHQSESYSEIGRQLGLSRGQVTRIARLQGIRRRPGKRPAALDAALAVIEAASPKADCAPAGEEAPAAEETVWAAPELASAENAVVQ